MIMKLTAKAGKKTESYAKKLALLNYYLVFANGWLILDCCYARHFLNVLISIRNGYKQLNDIASVDLWIEFFINI